MGLPIKINIGVNENNIIDIFLKKGVFEVQEIVKKTSSNAMDISIPYNIERILFLASNFDFIKIKKIMNEFEKNNKINIFDYDDENENLFKNLNKYFTSETILEKETFETIKNIYNKFNYIIDPHTSGNSYFYRYSWNYIRFKKEFK
jgi:threonine synthase